jgi:hypothetical protein
VKLVRFNNWLCVRSVQCCSFSQITRDITGSFFCILTQMKVLVVCTSAFAWVPMRNKNPAMPDTGHFIYFKSTVSYTCTSSQIRDTDWPLMTPVVLLFLKPRWQVICDTYIWLTKSWWRPHNFLSDDVYLTTRKPRFSIFLVRSKNLSRKTWHESQALGYSINWEIYTPYAYGATFTLTILNRKCDIIISFVVNVQPQPALAKVIRL